MRSSWATNKFRLGEAPEALVLQIAAVMLAALAPLTARASVLILFVACAAIGAIFRLRGSRLYGPDTSTLVGPAALVLWGALSALWSGMPLATLRATLGLAILLCVGFALNVWARSTVNRGPVQKGLTAGLAMGIAIYAFEWTSWGWLARLIHGFSWRDIINDDIGGTNVQSYIINGTAVLSLLLWPALVALRIDGRRWSAVALAIGVALVTFEFGSDAAMIALVLGGLAWFATQFLGSRAARGLAVIFIIVVLGFPYALQRTLAEVDMDAIAVETSGTIPSSALIRFYIWRFANDRIAEHPVIGWGFDRARSIPGGGDRFVVKDSNGRVLFAELNLPLHPHNQILQIWLELGAVGALIVAFGGGWMIDRLGRWPSPARQGGLALVCCALTYDTLSFGAWQSWWIAAVLLAAIFLQPYVSGRGETPSAAA